jgi:hypothetical protein
MTVQAGTYNVTAACLDEKSGFNCVYGTPPTRPKERLHMHGPIELVASYNDSSSIQ